MKSKLETKNYDDTDVSNIENLFDTRYFIANKRLLMVIGQWPYQPMRQRIMATAMIILVTVILMLPQTNALIKARHELHVFAACLSHGFANYGPLGMLFNCMLYVDKFREVLDEVKNDWETMTRLNKLKVIRQHGEYGRKSTILYSFLIYVSVLSFVLSALIPKTMDWLSPLNETRPRFDIFPTDYEWIDPDVYFWPIFFHITLSTFLIMTILVAIDSFYLTLSQHVCGMFKVLRNDLETLVDEYKAIDTVTLNPEYHEDIYYHQLVDCMKRHKSLLKYVISIQGTCEWSLFVVVGMSLVALSFTSYQALSDYSPKNEAIRSSLFVLAQLFHLYCITLPSHWISQASSLLPDSVYGCRWYMMSLRARKLMVIFIRASIEPCHITVGKVYVMSVENFCTVVQTSFSYLTMLISMQ